MANFNKNEDLDRKRYLPFDYKNTILTSTSQIFSSKVLYNNIYLAIQFMPQTIIVNNSSF